VTGFDGVALPLLIFVAEMCVVTISTVRIISLSRGMKYTAALLGLVEIVVWLFAIGQVMQNLNSLGCSLAFAVGFSLGNYLGVLIDQKLALGFLVVRVITARDPAQLVAGLKAAGYGVTRVDGRGGTGPVCIVLTVIARREFDNVIALLQRFDPNIFYSVDSLQTAAAGVFPLTRGRTATTMQAWRSVGAERDVTSSAAA
jgi:uncharacterized protein YebE (UPF0316 family)